jgi:hypothetical protein
MKLLVEQINKEIPRLSLRDWRNLNRLLVEARLPVSTFTYDGEEVTTTEPDILALGRYLHPNTGNTLICALKLSDMDQSQKEELAQALPQILAAGRAAPAHRRLPAIYNAIKTLTPDLRENYRTYNRTHISNLKSKTIDIPVPGDDSQQAQEIDKPHDQGKPPAPQAVLPQKEPQEPQEEPQSPTPEAPPVSPDELPEQGPELEEPPTSTPEAPQTPDQETPAAPEEELPEYGPELDEPEQEADQPEKEAKVSPQTISKAAEVMTPKQEPTPPPDVEMPKGNPDTELEKLAELEAAKQKSRTEQEIADRFGSTQTTAPQAAPPASQPPARKKHWWNGILDKIFRRQKAPEPTQEIGKLAEIEQEQQELARLRELEQDKPTQSEDFQSRLDTILERLKV